MSKLDYNSLASKVRSINPYRGTMRYPMDNRSNRQNIVELVETDKDIEFHISHGYKYNNIEISEARYNMMNGVRGSNVVKRTHEFEPYDFYTHEVTPRVLCIVRSDNTLEYLKNSYHQGDNMKISDWSHGYQYESYRMGGTTWSNGYGNNTTHPVFKGLRINQETREPVGMDVRVFRRTVNRKKGKDLMAAYREAFKSPDAMLKCMDMETMIMSANDVLSEYVDDKTGYPERGYFALAEECIGVGNNFDAVILYAVGQGIAGFNKWALQNYQKGRSYYRTTEPNKVVPVLMKSLAKKLYKEHQPFDEEEVDFRKATGSEWGLRVEVNGKEIVR